MKKIVQSVFILSCISTIIACGSGDKKTEEKENKVVETQVANDQKAMDSLEKVIKAQIDAVDDDSLMKGEH